MLTREQVIPLFLESCPSFRKEWDRSDQEFDHGLLYVVLGGFARHLLQLQQQGQTEEFAAVSEVIERLHVEGDSYVKNAATVGLLEAIQNVWGNNGVDPELFAKCLHQESARRWRSLNDFWSGKTKFVGEEL